MKVLVAIKHTINAYVKPVVKSDGSGVDLSTVKMSMNPFCEIAVEEAVRLKEAGKVSEIIVVSIGASSVQESLRKALGLGADRGILVQTDTPLEPLVIAKILKEIAQKEDVGLVLMGKQSIDGDNNQTPQMLAGLLAWSQGTFASQIALEGDTAKVTREVDGGLETLSLTLPSVLSTDLRLNEPRNVTLPNLMKAKQKPIETRPASEMGVPLEVGLKTLSVTEPAPRKAGVKVTSVQELVEKLRHEAGVVA